MPPGDNPVSPDHLPDIIPILGMPLACVTYESALSLVKLFAQLDKPAAVSACNTHIVATARQLADFGAVMAGFDLIFPDSTPLKWLMNHRGAGLPDRVYGPYFMRYALEHAGAPWKHYFFGGSETCLKNLELAARRLNPDIQIVGKCSPPFGNWDEALEAKFAQDIQEHDPDFIWVALGGERQERWIIRNQHRFKRGVFFAVGDAFELIAGHRPFAPEILQRWGLTWLYRLLQEPGRLWPRYFKYNSLFLLQLLAEKLFVTRDHQAPRRSGVLRIAFLGARGVPARYAGFETVVEELGSRLAARGHEVTVYNRSNHYRERPKTHRGMAVIYLPTFMTRSLETILHTTLAMFHALPQPYDVVYLCGVGNSCLAWSLRLFGKKVIVNVDGIDFKRSKWSGFARWWLYKSESWAVRFANTLIADNEQVVRHYQTNHDATPLHLSYGANIITEKPAPRELQQFNLRPGEYILFVSRLSPENEAHTLLEAYASTSTSLPLVVVGSAGYETRYYKRLKNLADSRVVFTGAQYGESYRELSLHCRFFVLPSAIEATRLVLLDQMSFGNAILFRESAATREVIGEAGMAFNSDRGAEALKEKIDELAGDRETTTRLGRMAQERVRTYYSWEKVTDRYETIFQEMIPPFVPSSHQQANEALGHHAVS